MRIVLAGLLTMTVWSAAQTVSVEQLTHRVPAGAAQEYEASTKALHNGKLGESIEHCLKALEADPANAFAHNDLGILYLNSGQMKNAQVEFERAAALAPGMAAAHTNESFALLAQGLPADAELSARRALAIAPNDRRANLLFGWSLTLQFRYSKEALAALQSAAREYPEAHLAAADVLVHNGSPDAARKEIEAYLSAGGVEQKTLAESWLRLLTIE